MGKWTNEDTAGHSGDSTSQAAEAAHDARDHATESGDLERGNSGKNSTRFKDNSGEATSFWSSIFGK